MPKLIANTAKMSESEWLELRKSGIGGSDAASIAGINKWASPVVMYMEKLGLYERKAAGEAASWGNILEPVVREHFKKAVNEERAEQGLSPLKVVHRMAIFAHDEHDFIRTNLDGLCYCEELGKGIVEIKTASEYLKEEWEGEDVPNSYFIQVQHNMLVMNVNYAYLAVLIGGNKYKHYFIERDQELIDYLINIESNFWNNHILTKIPPEMDGSDSTKEMLNTLYSESVEPEIPITLPSESNRWLEVIEECKTMIKNTKEKQTKYENMIKDEMKESETAFVGPHKVTWKANKNGTRLFKYKLAKAEVTN